MTWHLTVFALLLVEYHATELILAIVFMRDELGWTCEWRIVWHAALAVQAPQTHNSACASAALLITKPYIAAMAFGVAEHLLWQRAAPGLMDDRLVRDRMGLAPEDALHYDGDL